jgi:hypothetical protein
LTKGVGSGLLKIQRPKEAKERAVTLNLKTSVDCVENSETREKTIS